MQPRFWNLNCTNRFPDCCKFESDGGPTGHIQALHKIDSTGIGLHEAGSGAYNREFLQGGDMRKSVSPKIPEVGFIAGTRVALGKAAAVSGDWFDKNLLRRHAA